MGATASSVGSAGIKIPPQMGNTLLRYWEDLAQLRGKIHSIAAASNQIKKLPQYSEFYSVLLNADIPKSIWIFGLDYFLLHRGYI